jgi:hypothetical protein
LLGILEKMGCDVIWQEDGVVIKGKTFKSIDI